MSIESAMLFYAKAGLIQSLNKDRAEGVVEPSKAMP